jgi:hypothetical protein
MRIGFRAGDGVSDFAAGKAYLSPPARRRSRYACCMIAVLMRSAPNNPPPPVWVFLVFFAVTWMLVSFALSRFGGWTTLAGYYPAEHPFEGKLIRFQAAQLRRGTNYNGCLNFGASYEGLYIVPMLPFRAFHPPLLIPWTDITARPYKLWRFWNFVELRFQRAPDIPVRIRQSLAEKLAAASNQTWSPILPTLRAEK